MSRSGRINRGASRRAQLREDAEERAVERSSRSPEQQLARLDDQLGPGVGAKRERSRLSAMLEKKSVEKKKQRKPDGAPTKKGERVKAKARRKNDKQKASR